jgi:hypothetical protein
MSNRFRDGGRGNDSGGAAGTAQFFGQMMMMPFSVFVYSMQLFMQMLQGVTNQGRAATGCGCSEPCGCAQAGGGAQASGGAWGAAGGLTVNPGMQTGSGATAGSAGSAPQTTQKEERKMNDPNWGCKEEGWQVSDDCRNTEECDRLKLVRYKILFLKNNLEAAFPEEEELVTEDVTKDGFISWKVAEFVQRMARGEVRQPAKWHTEGARPGYPSHDLPNSVQQRNGVWYVTALPDVDKRFLRVYCEVLCWYDRERRNYERDQVDVLGEIRDELRRHNRGQVGSNAAEAQPSGD